MNAPMNPDRVQPSRRQVLAGVAEHIHDGPPDLGGRAKERVVPIGKDRPMAPHHAV